MNPLDPLRSRAADRFEWRALLSRGLLFAILFWIFAEGMPRYPWLALGFVIAAAATSLALLPARAFRIHAGGALRFLPWFLAESARGGFDVATRAIRPDLPLAPGFIEFRLRLAGPPARAFFANAVSLLPGTLSIELSADALTIHALDVRQPVAERLAQLEDRVAALFVDEAGGNREGEHAESHPRS